MSEQGFAIQKAQSRELSELRKSIKFHLYIEQSIKHQLTQPSYPNTIAIAIRITRSGTNTFFLYNCHKHIRSTISRFSYIILSLTKQSYKDFESVQRVINNHLSYRIFLIVALI